MRDEGAAIGFIRQVLTTPGEWEAWGLDEATLMIAQTSDPSVDSGLIGMPIRTIADEGIGRLTSSEAASADAALSAAARHWGDANTVHLGLSCTWHYGHLQHWTVVRYGGGTLNAVRVTPTLTTIEPVANSDVCFLLRPTGGGPAP